MNVCVQVRVFKDFEDGEESSHLVGDEAFALACSASKFYSAASGTNAVQSFSLEDGSSEGVVARFTADPTCVDVCADGSFLAAGSEDMTVKVVRGEEGGASVSPQLPSGSIYRRRRRLLFALEKPIL